MKKLELTVIRQNNVDAVKYDLGAADVYDDRVVDKITQHANIIPFQYKDEDGKRSITSYVHGAVNLDAMLKNVLGKKEVLCIMSGLSAAFEIGAQGIPVSYLVKDLNYIYVNLNTLTVKCILVPVKQDVMPLAEIPALFRTIISEMKFNEEDKDNYVAELLTLINSDDFSNSKFKALVDEQLEKMGMFISKDNGLVNMALNQASNQASNGIRVNKVDVMNNMQNSMRMQQAPMMPQQGQPMQPMPGAPRPMMPQQGQPMPGTPRPMMPQQGQPMPGTPRPMMPQQGQPMPQAPKQMQPQPMPGAPRPMMPQQGQPMPQAPKQMQPQPMPGAPRPMMPQQGQPMPQAPKQMQPQPMPGAPRPMMPQQGQPMPQAPKQMQPQPMPGAPRPMMPQQGQPMPQMPKSVQPQPEEQTTQQTQAPVMVNAEKPVEHEDREASDITGTLPREEITHGNLVGQLGMKPIPHIVRKKTGEIINITKPEFSIGKSKSKADYAIENNAAISRVHCIIVQRDGVNYIKDNNSTNHTYINGVELQPDKEMLLKNKTMIQLGDEEFTFLLRKGE